ncbi:MAG: metallophosphoesterase [Streptosporangiales bacterium]
MRVHRAVLGAFGVGAAGLSYAAFVERRWFRLRRFTVPVLAPGSRPLRVLHIADAHLTPYRRAEIAWIRGLAALEPDLIINTGDSIAHPDAVSTFLRAAGPLLERPGAFVFGSNDYYAPKLKNPVRYLLPSGRPRLEGARMLPWTDLRDGMLDAGWIDLSNARTRLTVAGIELEVTGVDDPHIGADNYDRIAGPVDPNAGGHLAVMHSPEPRILDRFAADGYELLLAGHTHGGQLCVPGYGALVTNCGLDRKRVKGLSPHRTAWLHVSAGLGTSPYAPARFACRPETSLLTLTARS